MGGTIACTIYCSRYHRQSGRYHRLATSEIVFFCFPAHRRFHRLKVFLARFAVPVYRDLAGTVRVCSSYRPVQGGLRTGKPSERYVLPVPGGMENLAF
ncbi:hypothetical protein GW17_00012383 [Ensete ventricosum]|nr:hypothetical protein GW17_00012383 [Ensete ventricosum]